MLAVAPVVRTTLVSCVYDPTGLAWVMLFDNTVLAWIVDEAGPTPARPVILGSLAPPAPDTTPIFSPQWAARDAWEFLVPDIARGAPGDFFTFLATNNGAHRPIFANFSDSGLISDFNAWGRAHPALWLQEVPS